MYSAPLQESDVSIIESLRALIGTMFNAHFARPFVSIVIDVACGNNFAIFPVSEPSNM
jgi:hypothetical protein